MNIWDLHAYSACSLQHGHVLPHPKPAVTGEMGWNDPAEAYFNGWWWPANSLVNVAIARDAVRLMLQWKNMHGFCGNRCSNVSSWCPRASILSYVTFNQGHSLSLDKMNNLQKLYEDKNTVFDTFIFIFLVTHAGSTWRFVWGCSSKRFRCWDDSTQQKLANTSG